MARKAFSGPEAPPSGVFSRGNSEPSKEKAGSWSWTGKRGWPCRDGHAAWPGKGEVHKGREGLGAGRRVESRRPGTFPPRATQAPRPGGRGAEGSRTDPAHLNLQPGLAAGSEQTAAGAAETPPLPPGAPPQPRAGFQSVRRVRSAYPRWPVSLASPETGTGLVGTGRE